MGRLSFCLPQKRSIRIVMYLKGFLNLSYKLYNLLLQTVWKINKKGQDKWAKCQKTDFSAKKLLLTVDFWPSGVVL